MKFEIIDKREYTITHWYIKSENDTYHVICQEGYLNDEWIISSDEEGELDRYSEIAKELIGMCSSDDSKPSDY